MCNNDKDKNRKKKRKKKTKPKNYYNQLSDKRRLALPEETRLSGFTAGCP